MNNVYEIICNLLKNLKLKKEKPLMNHSLKHDLTG